MKTVFVLAILAAVVLADPLFDAYLRKFGKTYYGEQYAYRAKVYADNMVKAVEMHRLNPSANFGETIFADMTEEEFLARYTMPQFRIPAAEPKTTRSEALPCLTWPVYRSPLPRAPAAFDWNTSPKVVLPVRDQGSCGSCWAFSTIEAIEGVYGVAGNPVPSSLSPQFIVDCSTSSTWEQYGGMNYTVYNQGCSGGWPWTAFWDVANKIGGVPLETAYPYTGLTGLCKGATGATYKVSGYTCVSTWQAKADEVAMADYSYTHGPLSIAVDVNYYFQLYQNGVLNPPVCDTSYVNHAILLTGWGNDAGTGLDFWNVKNSWGAAWGEAGYVRFARGKGTCGINEGVSIPFI